MAHRAQATHTGTTTTTGGGGTGRRARRAAAAAALGLAAVVALPALTTPAGAAPAAGSRITVTSTPLATPPGCLPAAQAVSATPYSDGSIFRLRIRVAAPLCDPITATAAIYAMPKDGSIWPQTLIETAAVPLSGAAVVDVTFAKDCTPSQFDVITGATPSVIAPWGQAHGPLLIPDTATAYQDPGIACGPATTTTTPASTTTVVAGVTTTAPGATTTSTTVAGVAVGGTTTVPTRVLDTSASSGDDPTGTSPATLAVTGVSSQTLAAWGMSLAAAGAALVLVARRRSAPAARMVTSAVSVQRRSPFSTS